MNFSTCLVSPDNIWQTTPSPPTKSLGFEGFDLSRLLIPRGGNSHVRGIYRTSPGEFDSRTLSRETPSRWTGRKILEVESPGELPVFKDFTHQNWRKLNPKP